MTSNGDNEEVKDFTVEAVVQRKVKLNVKGCPFCDRGGDPDVQTNASQNVQVTCLDCGLTSPGYEYADDAVSVWNDIVNAIIMYKKVHR